MHTLVPRDELSLKEGETFQQWQERLGAAATEKAGIQVQFEATFLRAQSGKPLETVEIDALAGAKDAKVVFVLTDCKRLEGESTPTTLHQCFTPNSGFYFYRIIFYQFVEIALLAMPTPSSTHPSLAEKDHAPFNEAPVKIQPHLANIASHEAVSTHNLAPILSALSQTVGENDDPLFIINLNVMRPADICHSLHKRKQVG